MSMKSFNLNSNDHFIPTGNLITHNIPCTHFRNSLCLCVAVFSSLSLNLLPERAATFTVFDDVVQIVSGYQGNKPSAMVIHLISFMSL